MVDFGNVPGSHLEYKKFSRIEVGVCLYFYNVRIVFPSTDSSEKKDENYSVIKIINISNFNN